MKLLAYIGQMHKGGAERVMSLLVNESVARGFQTCLLVGRHVVEYDIDKGVQVIPMDTDSLNPVSRIKKIRQIFKEEKPDAIISFMSSPSIYACLSAVGLDIPVIISERNTPEHEVSDKIHEIIRNIAYRFASGAIFQTEQARDFFFDKLRKNSVVIPNPVKDNLPESDRMDIKHEIVTMGRLETQKNQKMLIKAFSLFSESHSDYVLIIYGRGALKESLLNYSEQLGLKNKVKINDPIDNVHEEIKNSAMFVMSSDYEGISNALLECMAMGLPCISTDCPCGGSRMLIDNGKNGLLVPVGDAEDLCNAMTRIADNREFADTISKNAKLLKEKYCAKEIMGRYLDYVVSISKHLHYNTSL